MRCPDCDDGEGNEIDRREFIKTVAVGGVGLVTTAAPKLYGSSETLLARPKAKERSETLVATLYKSLSEEQKQKVAFPFDHPLRSKVDNNWQITPVTIAEFFKPDQQAMITEIFRGLHNPEFVDKVLYHINEDAGGLGKYSVALFGEPGGGAFEFVLTGRHCTARCDGDSVEGTAFGGPIFYGHASQSFNEKPDHPKNVYWYQAKRANEVFQALDGKQRKIALPATSASWSRKCSATCCCPSARRTASKPCAISRPEAGSTSSPCRFTRIWTSATTACGTCGNWKAPAWSGTSAARRTCTSGLTCTRAQVMCE